MPWKRACSGITKPKRGKPRLPVMLALMRLDGMKPKRLDCGMSNKLEKQKSEAAAILGREGGKSKSDAKVKASAKNGQLGGRPKKQPKQEKTG